MTRSSEGSFDNKCKQTILFINFSIKKLCMTQPFQQTAKIRLVKFSLIYFVFIFLLIATTAILTASVNPKIQSSACFRAPFKLKLNLNTYIHECMF